MAGKMYKKGTIFGKPKSEVVKHPGVFSAAASRAGKTTHDGQRRGRKGASRQVGETGTLRAKAYLRKA